MLDAEPVQPGEDERAAGRRLVRDTFRGMGTLDQSRDREGADKPRRAMRVSDPDRRFQ